MKSLLNSIRLDFKSFDLFHGDSSTIKTFTKEKSTVKYECFNLTGVCSPSDIYIPLTCTQSQLPLKNTSLYTQHLQYHTELLQVHPPGRTFSPFLIPMMTFSVHRNITTCPSVFELPARPLSGTLELRDPCSPPPSPRCHSHNNIAECIHAPSFCLHRL